jgi:predicted transcriptional regulator of viral defense system
LTKPTAEAKRPPRTAEPVELILKIVRASRKGIDVPAIQKRTGLDPVKIRNTIFAALHKGLIQRVSRGFYKGI